jgi:hypothetical protein
VTSIEHIEKPFEPANLRAYVQRYLRPATVSGFPPSLP